ncbi:MAG TPA: hypothetical protein VFY64_07395 [Nitrososphaeraceae archaeon]|nr:hypothetical protein [Nitrososphaeraceae archaeon]
MPIFPMKLLVEQLISIGVNCKIGNPISDIHNTRKPYFERWLLNRDGFLTLNNENIDYIGIEEIVRLGPFYNVYCLIENQHLSEKDDSSYNLLSANPYFHLRNGKVITLGWSGGLLADILTQDTSLCDSFSANIVKEEIRKLSVKVSNFACIIETHIWEPSGLVSIYPVIDRIGLNIKRLLKQIHLGEDNFVP